MIGTYWRRWQDVEHWSPLRRYTSTMSILAALRAVLGMLRRCSR